MALKGCGIIRVPLHAVKTEIAEKKLDVILKNVSVSPERMCAYYARAKRLPAKTADFITFLATSICR
jgi:DNA-binding transcriptional LysR family regulator